MHWGALPASADKIALAQTLVDVTSRALWGRTALQRASQQAFGDETRWQEIFPRRSREAIWFISEASDASMRAAFAGAPTAHMSAVVAERLMQNQHLKHFVRRVMLFDFAHPTQAIARMQRTARVMTDCLELSRRPQVSIAALNVTYTLIVFVWLFDRDNRTTASITKLLMRMIGLD